MVRHTEVRRSIVPVRTSMTLQAPWTIYVDEAGSDSFREAPEAERRAYIVCAVAVPTTDLPALRRILPRGSSGEFLKSSHAEWNRHRALAFARDLLATRAEVSAFMANPGAPENIEVFRDGTTRANEGRRRFREGLPAAERAQHPDITGHDLHYMLFLSWVLVELRRTIHTRTRNLMTFADVILDNKSIEDFQRQWFRVEFPRLADEHEWRIGRLDWCREEDEPLLLLPDLVAGIIHREEVHRDVGAAAHKLWEADRDGRIRFLNKAPTRGDSSGAKGGTERAGHGGHPVSEG